MAIIGLSELKANLLKISKAVHDEVLPEAIGAAAEVIKTEMESAVQRGGKFPAVQTGFLMMHIKRQKVLSARSSGGGIIGERVGPDDGDFGELPFYPIWLEYGHIAMGPRRSKRAKKGNTHSQSGVVPNMELKGKRPFVRPTLDAAAERAVNAATEAARMKLESMGIK